MRLGKRLFSLVLAMAAILGWAGCGGGCPTATLSSTGASSGPGGSVSTTGTVCGPGTTPPPANGNTAAFLYYWGRTLSWAPASLPLGRSLPLPPSAPTLPSSVGTDMVIVNKKFLYLPQNDSLTIQAFTIDRHHWSPEPQSAEVRFASVSADSIASDPAGRFLFVGSDTTGQISVFQINASNGRLGGGSGFTVFRFQSRFRHVLAVDGSGKFLYASQGSHFLPIYGFSIDQNTGALSQVIGSPFVLNVAGVRTDFTGKYAVGLTGIVGDNHLYVFAIDPTTGALAPVTEFSFCHQRNHAVRPESASQQSVCLQLSGRTSTAMLRPLRVSSWIRPPARLTALDGLSRSPAADRGGLQVGPGRGRSVLRQREPPLSRSWTPTPPPEL